MVFVIVIVGYIISLLYAAAINACLCMTIFRGKTTFGCRLRQLGVRMLSGWDNCSIRTWLSRMCAAWSSPWRRWLCSVSLWMLLWWSHCGSGSGRWGMSYCWLPGCCCYLVFTVANLQATRVAAWFNILQASVIDWECEFYEFLHFVKIRKFWRIF